MDLTRKGYYYHPLGDLAKAIVNGETTTNELSYVDDDLPSGFGILEWGTGPKIPGGVSLYAMATGTIYQIKSTAEEKKEGFEIYLRTEKLDDSDQRIVIKYSCCGGLVETIASAVGCKSGALDKDTIKKLNINYSCTIKVECGAEIAYTNTWNEKSMVRISFIYERHPEDDNSTTKENLEDWIKEYVPHITDINNLSKDIEVININNPLAKYAFKNGDNFIGAENGMARKRDGTPSLYYPMWPFLSYLSLQQVPTYLKATGVGPDGGIPMLNASEIISGDTMDQDALNFYVSGTMSDSWIGSYPETIADVNANSFGLRYAVAICKRELNFDIFSGASYAKLLRAKMIGEKWQSGNNMKEWFEGLHPSQFAGKSTWLSMTIPEEDLTYAQLVYLNLKYPSLYGQELANISNEFQQAVIYGCQQIPIYNLSPIAYGPHAFVVNFDVSANKDVGSSGGAGNFLMYRQRDGDMKSFNPKVGG